MMRLLTTATDSEKLYDYNLILERTSQSTSWSEAGTGSYYVVCPDLGFVLRLYIRVPVAA